jgi:neurotransmitter:Na+ symporter, NSS family
MSSSNKQQWGSRLGVILAVAGSAVGLGNFLRFPGQAAANGGGAFMIPYFCALLLLGIPLGWAEWAMGRYGGRKGFHSAPAILGVMGKGKATRYLGVLGVLIPLGVYFYYVLIESWCLGYTLKYLSGGIGIPDGASIANQVAASTAHHGQYTGRGADGGVFDLTAGWNSTLLVPFLLTIVANVILLYRGLSGGIETFCKWAMPVMAIFALIVLGRVLTLPADAQNPDQNVLNGLAYMWNPHWDKLGDPGAWMAAAGQIFFSLSVGFGVIINYASYLKKKDDVVLSGLTASATNEYFEVAMGGLITLTAAFVFLGMSLNTLPGGTFGLGFQTLPVVFAHMPLGNAIGAIWFFMLFLAAITSSLSMLQPTLAFVEEATGISRKAAVSLVVAISLIGNAYVMYFSKDSTVLDTIDAWVGTFLIVVLALVQALVFGWIFGIERGMEEAHHGAQMRIPKVFWFIIKYVSPAFLIWMLFNFCKDVLPGWIDNLEANPAAQNAVYFIGAVIVFLVVLTAIGEKRWRAAGLDVDGKHPPKD